MKPQARAHGQRLAHRVDARSTDEVLAVEEILDRGVDLKLAEEPSARVEIDDEKAGWKAMTSGRLC